MSVSYVMVPQSMGIHKESHELKDNSQNKTATYEDDNEKNPRERGDFFVVF